MKFTPLPLNGAFLIELDLISDERGFFARTWCEQEFSSNGLNPNLKQCSVSYNIKRGTLRGMHYQAGPHEETKVVRCTQGAIYDVLLDLRPGSPTYCAWTAEELSAESRRMLYIPEGVAHGFQTLTDSTEVFYQISDSFFAELSRGVRWNDPVFDIEWPDLPDGARTISARDRDYSDFQR